MTDQSKTRAVPLKESLAFKVIESTCQKPIPHGRFGFQFPPRVGDYIPSSDAGDTQSPRMWEVIAIIHAVCRPGAGNEANTNCGDVYVRDIGPAQGVRRKLGRPMV